MPPVDTRTHQVDADTPGLSGRTSPPERMICLGCEYDLRDLNSQRCPECGRAFDRGDPRTFGGWIPGWLLRGDRHVGPVIAGASVACGTTGVLVDAMMIRDDDSVIALCVLASAALFGVAACRAATGAAVLAALRAGRSERRRLVFRRVRLPVLGLALCVIALFNGGAWGRIWASAPWIVPAARSVIQSGPGTCDSQARRLGFFNVNSINYGDPGTRRGALVWVNQGERKFAIFCSPNGYPIFWGNHH